MVDSRVPIGAGLSSSAALECALAVALDELAELGLVGDDAGRARLASVCVQAENEIAGAPTGGMDQAASLRSRAGCALLLDCLDFSVELVPFDLAGAGLELLVIDTRSHHSLVDGQYAARREACGSAARVLGVATLREVAFRDLDVATGLIRVGVTDLQWAADMAGRLRHVVTEIARVEDAATLLRTDQLRRLGPLLDASHASLREDYEVSCPELDLACAAALEAGALGARMTGGGFGGSVIALVDTARTADVAASVASAFDGKRFPAPAFMRAVPADPAQRVR